MFLQRLFGLGAQVNKDKAFPGVCGQWGEAKCVFIKIKKVRFIGNKTERAFKRIRPAVELAAESLAAPALIPDNLIAPMRADIMESPYLTVLAAYNQDRGAAHRQVFDIIVSRVGDVINTTDVEPEFAKNFFALLFKIRRRDARFDRHWFGAQCRVVFMPDFTVGLGRHIEMLLRSIFS